MRGRKPELQVIEGGLANVPPPPTWFSPEAVDAWNRVVPILVERQTLTEGDIGTLETYCTALGLLRQCQATIAKDGSVVQGKAGPRRHPALQTMMQAMTEARRYAAELGLTPAARNKPGSKPAENDDAWAGMDI